MFKIKVVLLLLTESTTPLNDAYQGGTFIFYNRYGIYQTTSNIDEQITLLKNRSLLISNTCRAN